MAFVQIIEFETADIDELMRVTADWERATEGKRTARRLVLGRDRDDPDRYVQMVFFDSYESAMANSGLPETDAAARAYAVVTKGEPVFRNLDIIDDRS